MPKILAIDSSHAHCSVALCHGDDIDVRESSQERQHARQMLPMIEELLAGRKMRIKELDAIALVSGPGSFTGLRIGAGVAQGLALGAGLPVVGVSSLAVMAMKAWQQTGHRHLLVCLNAREGEVYSAAYVVDEGDALLLGSEKVGAPGSGTFDQSGPEYEWYAVGDGWEHVEKLQSGTALQLKNRGMLCVSDAAALCHLAQVRLSKGLSSVASEALPVYLKEQMDYQG